MANRSTPSTALASDFVWRLVESTTSRRVPWSAIVDGEEGSELLSIEAIPVVRPTPFLEHSVRLLAKVKGLTKLVLSFDSSSQPAEVFRVLRGFERLEELEITFDDASRALEVFPHVATLQQLTIKNVRLSEAALDSLATKTTLHSLRLQNVQYVGGLNALYQFTNLRRLEVSGCVPVLSENIDFLRSMPGIEEVFLEMETPEERVLKTLSSCRAEISLKLHGCCIHAFSSALAEIPNLTSLIFVTRCCLAIPTSFQALKRLRSVSFVDHASLRIPVVGLENLPHSVTKLSLDLNSIFLTKHPFPDQLTSRITELVTRMPIIGTKLGLSKFKNLQFLELSAKKELDGEVLQEIKQLRYLKNLKLAACLNITKEMLLHFAQLPLDSLSISNSTITTDSLSGIQCFLSLRTLAFHSCLFINLNLDCLPSLPTLDNLVLDRCTPIEEHLLDILSSPFIGRVESVQFGLSKVLSDDQSMQVYAKQQELGLVVSIQYYQNV